MLFIVVFIFVFYLLIEIDVVGSDNSYSSGTELHGDQNAHTNRPGGEGISARQALHKHYSGKTTRGPRTPDG